MLLKLNNPRYVLLLETLNIGLNSLSELPNLTTLNNLITLYANHNLLESIPASITSLASLSILNLFGDLESFSMTAAVQTSPKIK